MAYFVSVECFDGQLTDARIDEQELDDNFCIKIKIIRIELERYFIQCGARINPVSAVPFSKSGAEKKILCFCK